MSGRGAISYRELLKRLRALADPQYRVEEETGQKTSIRHLKRVQTATGQVGRRADGKAMIHSVSVKREGDEMAPHDAEKILRSLGIDPHDFW